MKVMDTFYINLEIVSCPFLIARDSETISLVAIMSMKHYGRQFALLKICVKFNIFHMSQTIHSNFYVNLMQEYVRK